MIHCPVHKGIYENEMADCNPSSTKKIAEDCRPRFSQIQRACPSNMKKYN